MLLLFLSEIFIVYWQFPKFEKKSSSPKKYIIFSYYAQENGIIITGKYAVVCDRYPREKDLVDFILKADSCRNERTIIEKKNYTILSIMDIDSLSWAHYYDGAYNQKTFSICK